MCNNHQHQENPVLDNDNAIVDFDEFEELFIEGFEELAFDITYEIKEVKNQRKETKFIYFKCTTWYGKHLSYRFPVDYLKSTNLKDGFNALIQYGTPCSQSKGRLVSSKKQLRAIFVEMGLISKTPYSALYKICFEDEPYLDILNQYFSYELLLNKEITDYKFVLDASSPYFTEKAERLKNLGANNDWHLSAVLDTLGTGQCTLGHNLRYLYVVTDNLGNKLKFGIKCVRDFFLVTGKVQSDLLKFVTELRNLQVEFLNSYLTDYEESYPIEELFIQTAYQVLKRLPQYKLDLEYLLKFKEYKLPVPKPLAYRLTLALCENLSKNVKDVNKDDILYLAITGLNGQMSNQYGANLQVATDHYGNRIQPKVLNILHNSLRKVVGYSYSGLLIPKDLSAISLIGAGSTAQSFDILLLLRKYNIIDHTFCNVVSLPQTALAKLKDLCLTKETKEEAEQVIKTFIFSYGLDLIESGLKDSKSLHYKKSIKKLEPIREIMLKVYRSINNRFVDYNMTTILLITKYNEILEFLSRPLFTNTKDELMLTKVKNATSQVQSYRVLITGINNSFEDEVLNKAKEMNENKDRYTNSITTLKFLQTRKSEMSKLEQDILDSCSKFHSISERQYNHINNAYNKIMKKNGYIVDDSGTIINPANGEVIF